MPFGMNYPPHEHIHERGSEGSGPSESGEMSETSLFGQAPHKAPNGMPVHDQIETFGESAPSNFPDGDNSSPSVPSVSLVSQGDQRKFAMQSRLSVPGDNRITEGGQKSDPHEAMPGAD